jgi:hypothetical protein
MISWRYHIVSIVAVVLAFGLGIVAGTLGVSDPLVEQLQKNYDEAVADRDAALATAALYEDFLDGLQPTLRNGALSGERAVVITMTDVVGPAQRAVQELATAGADVLATLEITERMAAPGSAGTAQALGEIVGAPGVDGAALVERAAEALAGRLAEGTLTPEGDLLGALLADSFLAADRDLDAAALVEIGGAGQLVVIAAGGRPPATTAAPEAVLVPLTQRLDTLGVSTVAVGPSEDPYGYVRAVRDANGIPDCSIVTVDDIDQRIGGLTLVMAVVRYLADDDPVFLSGGDYGLEGDMIVPGADEPPDSCRR